jgi:ABC-type branched-subunit amino acid transport system substrate-binding protein
LNWNNQKPNRNEERKNSVTGEVRPRSPWEEAREMKQIVKNKGGFGKPEIVMAVITITVVLVGLAVFFILSSKKEETIKIGAVLTLTGPAGDIGIDVRDGMLLAVDEINAWGGINGRYIELIIEDSKTNPQEGKKAFNKIEADHHPLLYVSNLSSVSVQDFRFITKRRLVDSKLEGG